MGYVIAFCVLGCLYIGYLIVVIPLSALAAFVYYAVGVPIIYLIGLFQVLAVRPDTLPPARRVPVPRDGADPARLGYFHGPAFADVEHVVAVALGSCKAFWTRGIGMVTASLDGDRRADGVYFTAPVGVGGVLGMGAGTLVGMVGFVLASVVHCVLVGTVFLLARAMGIVLRGADSTLLLIKNIRMSCPHCFERVPYPAYLCGGCGRLHRDVRPGRYGSVRRQCLCGARLPTLLLFGSAGMEARCPHPGCGRPMEHRPGDAREVVLPFFGATGAGKTRLLYAVVALLRAWSEQGRLSAETADAATAADLDDIGMFLATGRATAKTHMDLPRGQVIRLTSGGNTRLLQLFDAAGERFYQGDKTQELGYLARARTFVLVIDPLSVEAFWAGLPAPERHRLSSVRSQAPSPELAYQQTHQQMEAMGIRLSRARLAVVFSRADMLAATPGSGEDIERWAREALGLGNLVRSVRHQFGEIRFFHTAAVIGEDGAVHPSVGELAGWLLARDRIALPQPPPAVPGTTGVDMRRSFRPEAEDE